jgi:hypothetical protein
MQPNHSAVTTGALYYRKNNFHSQRVTKSPLETNFHLLYIMRENRYTYAFEFNTFNNFVFKHHSRNSNIYLDVDLKGLSEYM